MKSHRILRATLLFTALGAALSAHAVNILLASSGTTTFSPSTVATETVYTQVGGFGPLSSLVLTDDGITGTGTYTGANDSLSFTYAFVGTGTQNGPAFSSTATWTATGGTGTYAGAAGSVGTFALTTIGTGNTVPSGTVFAGDIQAVPEPASMAALGVGALGLLRRRKA